MKNLLLSILVLGATTAPATEVYKYAPRPTPMQGTRTLTCLGLKYQDTEAHTDAAKCKAMANRTADFYRRNSRGLLQLKGSGFQVNVPYDGKASNFYPAEKFAIDKHKGFDLYQVVGILGTSHSGNHVAHLRGTLQRDADHEVGHLLGLGHAGAYKEVNGKLALEAYRDGGSVMGKFPSDALTAPQYYFLGWLPEKEAALYEPGKTYQLKKIVNFGGSGLAVVIVRKEGRDAFISWPNKCENDPCLALHLGEKGGSQRVKMFGKEYYDTEFTGLHIKMVSSDGATVKVTIDYDKKPS